MGGCTRRLACVHLIMPVDAAFTKLPIQPALLANEAVTAALRCGLATSDHGYDVKLIAHSTLKDIAPFTRNDQTALWQDVVCRAGVNLACEDWAMRTMKVGNELLLQQGQCWRQYWTDEKVIVVIDGRAEKLGWASSVFTSVPYIVSTATVYELARLTD